uniref:Bet protein n=1 Tax=Simian foamy virus TaxID=11642 RepID=K7ZBX3_9RETR|nr:bet protein [Simian foamy virus]
MDTYQEEESVASTSGVQDLQTLSELVGPEAAGEGEDTLSDTEEVSRRSRKNTKRGAKMTTFHAYKEIEDKNPQNLKLHNWIPTPEEMINKKVQNQDLGTILSFGVKHLKGITSLGRNDPGRDPSAMSPVLPVVTPWPFSQDHYAPTLYGILLQYYKYSQNNEKIPRVWQFTCLEDPSGKRYMGTRIWVPPLGQVTIQFYKNFVVLTVCQAVDPWANWFHGSEEEMYDIESEPDVWCSAALCFKVIYEGNINQKQEMKSWLCRLGHGHKDGVSEFKRVDLFAMRKGKVNPYKDKGDPWLQYAYQVKRETKAANLSDQALGWKALNFHRALMCDLTNARIGEGHVANGYHMAIEAYGPQRGSSEERVWWKTTSTLGKDEEYYRSEGEEEYFPNSPAPHRRTWTERHKVLALSPFATPSDIQKWVTRALPYKWKVITSDGDDYVSMRTVKTLKELTQDEIKCRWEKGNSNPFYDSGSDSDGPF